MCRSRRVRRCGGQEGPPQLVTLAYPPVPCTPRPPPPRLRRPKRPPVIRPGKEAAMRGCMLFVTGLLVGVGLQTVAAQSPNAQSPNKGLVQVNHIGMNVPNLDEAVTYYTKTLGFPEAFRANDEKGQAPLIYEQE